MKTSELNFNLPKNLIAQKPVHPADQASLMILNRDNNKITQDTFLNLGDYLKSNDVLVFNDSKVLPARLIGTKQTGGKTEVLLLKNMGKSHWEALVKNGSNLVSQTIVFSKKLSGNIEEKMDSTFKIHFNISGKEFIKELQKIGQVPTPPYIKELIKEKDYQTIFAKKLGSAAAPTAGLHFTKRLMKKLEGKGVQTEFVTLHVGLGTFQPIQTERVEDHQIHSEYYEIDLNTLKRLNIAKQEGRRIIAVGTTSCRVLETIHTDINDPTIPLSSETDIFIYPGYKFNVIDALITNFHTPNSSLLALVMSFAGKKLTAQAYEKAIQEKWRFFSLGDGMIIL